MVPLPVNCFFIWDRRLGLTNIKLPPLEILVGIDLLPIIMQEVFIGLSCGMVLSICFGAVILAGEKIAATSGWLCLSS